MYHTKKNENFLECERWWIYVTLMFVAGFYGAFTYAVRGGVFCNAQTANFVLFAMALGNKNLWHALYYFIPMGAYLLGSVISEIVATPIKRRLHIRWDTILILVEICAVLFLGFLPETAPFQISQVIINFICSMQYNTFRNAQDIPMATTFCTNHLRQTGIALAEVAMHRSTNTSDALHRLYTHLEMLAVFVIGGICATALCHLFRGKAIFFTLIPLLIAFADLLYADLKKEKNKLNQVPRGHQR